MKELLLLSPVDPEKNKPTKILDKDLNKVKSFSAGLKFNFETLEYENIHVALADIFCLRSSFLVLGQLTEYGEEFKRSKKAGRRTKKKGTPTIQDRDGPEIVLDLDDHFIENFDPLNPEPSIKNWLIEKGIDADTTWQITSGQKLNSTEARIRLYIEADKPYSLKVRKAWSQSPVIEADGSVYTCSQPIYTAPPIIEGGVDPISSRTGFIEGVVRQFKVPKLTQEEVKKYGGHLRGSSDFDFNDSTLPKEVLSGIVYRRYFMPLAFHYVNKGLSEEDVFHLISAKATQVTSREFHEENVREYIADAFAKYREEGFGKVDLPELKDSEDISYELDWPPGLMGQFSRDIYESADYPNKAIAICTAFGIVAGIQGVHSTSMVWV